ncbi:MAG: 3-deoxy-8-phosphooctulonate synthase [Candidatus Latescibacterota bacterium]
MVSIGRIPIGEGKPLVLIAGPCVIESETLVMETAEAIKRVVDRLRIPFIFKASYAKENRLSIDSFSGPGIETGLRILERVRSELEVPVLTDVHSPSEAAQAGAVVDVLQIPAFLCRQTDLALAVGRVGKPVNIKKAPFLSPEDMGPIARKIESVGNAEILLTERGTSFGYHDLVVDMRAIVVMRQLGYPVVFDATHSVQRPGQAGSKSGGNPEFIFPLARAAVAVGVDAIFIETHPCPPEALCDAATMLPLGRLEALLTELKVLDEMRIERLHTY